MNMNQEQRNKKAEQLRLAAQIIETGCGWEVWSGISSAWCQIIDKDPTAFVFEGSEIRIKQPAWKLPDPPAGRRWHREDWTQDMLPDGWRPLLLGEKAEQGDEIYPLSGNDDWKGKWQTDVSWWMAASESMFPSRTRRPLPEPMIPIPKGWRELRDDEKDYKWVVGAKYLADNGEWMHPKHRDGGAFAAKTHRIIVPVAKPRVPLGPEDVAPGSVIRPVKRPDSVSDCWAAVISTGEVGVQAVRRGDIEGYSYSDLMAEFEIKRPADTKFQPCSKEAES